MLGAEVSRSAVHGNQAGNGADIDYLTMIALSTHLGQELLHHEPVRVYIGLIYPANILLRNMLNIGQCAYACVVDQHVNSAELLHNRVKYHLAIVKDRDICLDCKSITAQTAKLCGSSLCLIAMDVHNRNIGTALGKAHCDGLTNSVCAAGDNYLCVFKISKHMRFSFLHKITRFLLRKC